MKKYRYNPYTMMYETKEMPRALRIAFRVLSILSFIGLVAFYLWCYTSVFHFDLPSTALLKRSCTRWESKVNVMERQMEFYSSTLHDIEERDNSVYRSIFGMDSIWIDTVGRRASAEDKLLSIEKRVVARSQSLDSVLLVAVNAGDMMLHVPAVPPIMPRRGAFRISSPFGGRTDPVHHSRAFHEGQDFAAKKGTPIYATADGVVEEVKVQFRGYGNEVLINHGFGYKTLYAHMQKIVVAEGMRVQRGDMIGTVGNTGKSTGPHVHYEVRYKGKKMNPANYMDMKITEAEYRAMIRQREIEDVRPFDKKSTTTELLRKRH